jgi:hypothetical protein
MSSDAATIPHNLRCWLRRRSLRHLWYRVRLASRRRRWLRQNIARTAAYAKSDVAVYGAEPVLVVGEFGASYGLSRGATYDLQHIRELHEDVTVVNIRDLQGDGAGGPAIDRARRYGTVYLMCQPDTYGRIFSLFAPEQLADAYRVGRWVWETPLFPKAWSFALPLVHRVWSASAFAAEAFRATGLPVEVHPHSVAPPPPIEGGRQVAGVADTAFMGLAIMDIQSCPDRKNPWAHVRAWLEAFGDDPTAVLVLKLRIGKRTRVVVEELREIIGPATNIRLLTHEMTHDEIASLQTACDVYLSLHRSEGYGLNIAECLAIGKPTVATHWSANIEYGPQFPNYHGVASRMIPYDDWLLHYEDARFSWAEADVDEAAQKLRALRRARAAVPAAVTQ